MQIGFLGWREPCEQRGKCTKNTYQQTSPLPSHQQEFSSLLGSFFSTHILSDWSKINRLFKPVFSLCRGLETSHSYHTHAAADGASTSVWPALRQAHRGEEKSCIIKAREWLWSIKKKRKKKKVPMIKGGSTSCASRKAKRWFSISSVAIPAHWPRGEDSEVCEMGDNCGV